MHSFDGGKRNSPKLNAKRLLVAAGIGAAVMASSLPAFAAGYDTPILYSARHQGMGGTAIGYVDDPSAVYHNPAGLQNVHGFAALADFSLVLARIQASPGPLPSTNSIESNLVVGPFFLAGVGIRLHEWVSAGLAFFPVASASAEYEYALGGQAVTDETKLVFLELTPAVSLNVPEDLWIPGKLGVGVGYRINTLNFERFRGDPDDPRELNLSMDGANFTGFRLGAQYKPNDRLSFGVSYRSRVEITAEADQVVVQNQIARDAKMPFILPSRLGAGARVNIERVGLALDAEYAFQSQNDRVELSGTLNGVPTSVQNVFDWEDAVTLRFGVEVRLGADKQYPLRAGYVFDGITSREAFPTAFGTPPTATHSVTIGAGYDARVWEVNLALAQRLGSTDVVDVDQTGQCQFCSYPGEYEISATGIYVDASVDFEL